MADCAWLRILIPGRPVREVTVLEIRREDFIDMNFFTLSTAPIRKLNIPFTILYQEPGSFLAGSFLAPIFPSLVDLKVEVYDFELKSLKVRRPPFDLSI
jgi:hypothetical protein